MNEFLPLTRFRRVQRIDLLKEHADDLEQSVVMLLRALRHANVGGSTKIQERLAELEASRVAYSNFRRGRT